MQAVFLKAVMSTLVHLVSAIFASGVFAEIEKLVMAQMDTNKTPAEKQKAVKDGLASVKGELGDAIKSTANWALNLGIEVVVATTKVKLGAQVSK